MAGPYGVTPTGFNKKKLQDIRTEILEGWKAKISSELNTSETSLEGQFAGSFAEQLAQAWDAQEAEYASRDPAQAEGQALDDLLHLRGVYRKPATQSLVTAVVNLDAGTYAAGDLVASVVGAPTSLFANDQAITTAGGNVSTVFRALSDGPVHANAGTLTSISVPATGWNSITNPNDAILGKYVESDADYYARAEQELAVVGQTTADSIRGAILALNNVTFARVYVNDDPTDNGFLGGNAIGAVVRGGDDQAIRDAILAKKAGGIRALGLTGYTPVTGTAVDSQGNVYNINFTRPVVYQPYVTINPKYNPDLYPGDPAVEQYILDWGDANLDVGMDVIHNKIVQLVMDLPGVYDVDVAMGSTPSPVSDANYVIPVAGIADLDSTRVVVLGTSQTGPA